MNTKEDFDITKYIKSQLEGNNEIECLEGIGKALSKYLNYENIVKEMDDYSIKELEEAIYSVQFQRKSFTKFIVCSREEANKEETELRSKGYFTYGEWGGDYGYFQHKKELTEEQKEWFEDHIECCYYHGQPCEVWQKEELDDWDEDCECRLGRDFSSLVLYELDEEEEKRLGIWQQDIKWSLNGCRYDYYYSLEYLKRDALNSCIQCNEKPEECPICKKIFSYDGKEDLITGSVNIKAIKNDSDY